MKKLQIFQTIGFTFEILTFTFAGMLLERGNYIRGGLVIIAGVILALGVGVFISKSAIEKYKEVNR